MYTPIFFVFLAIVAIGQAGIIPGDDDNDDFPELNLCPNHESDLPTFVPNPYDCTKYYECSNGRQIAMKCPKGLEFNYLLSICDFPENSKCFKPE